MSALLAAVSSVWAVIRLYAGEIAAFVSALMITDARNDAKQQKTRADALDERISQENRIDAMSDADVSAELRNKWTRH